MNSSRRESQAHFFFICRRIGFDNLNPIIWHKIANAAYEVANGSKFLGKPYEPNAIIKNDIEFIKPSRMTSSRPRNWCLKKRPPERPTS